MGSLQQPSMVPPPDGDTSKGPSMLIIIWLFTGISTIVVGLKMWTRLKIIPLSAFAHVFLAVVPIFGLWKIRIKLKTKIGVCLLMGTTAIAAIAAIGRTVNTASADLRTDFTYAVHRLSKWATIEAAFIIIASCIPSLRPFVRVLGKSLHIESARAFFVVPKGYHHSHSRRHRPPPLVPRDSGSGTPALGSGTTARPSPKDKYEVYSDVDRDVEKGDGRTNEVATSGVGATSAEKIVEKDERGGVGEKGVDTTVDSTTTSITTTNAEKSTKDEKQGENAEKGTNVITKSSAASSTPKTEDIDKR
ncbi:MAG: hypothetical protein Q9176_007789 [Flavoplaca citrina]